MNNILLMTRKTARMTCAWVPTGDPRTPLACVWTDPEFSLAVRRYRSDSLHAPATSYRERAGAGGISFAFRNHLSTTSAQRSCSIRSAVGESPVEQPGELDDYRIPVRSVSYFGTEGTRPELDSIGKVRMSSIVSNYDSGVFAVVHPLDDQPEQKYSDESLGPMKMGRSVRFSLFVLRAYLVAMVGLVVYRLLELTAFTHH